LIEQAETVLSGEHSELGHRRALRSRGLSMNYILRYDEFSALKLKFHDFMIS
jgi:hypothetical protein